MPEALTPPESTDLQKCETGLTSMLYWLRRPRLRRGLFVVSLSKFQSLDRIVPTLSWSAVRLMRLG